jgi:hypothetical protein
MSVKCLAVVINGPGRAHPREVLNKSTEEENSMGRRRLTDMATGEKYARRGKKEESRRKLEKRIAKARGIGTLRPPLADDLSRVSRGQAGEALRLTTPAIREDAA